MGFAGCAVELPPDDDPPPDDPPEEPPPDEPPPPPLLDPPLDVSSLPPELPPLPPDEGAGAETAVGADVAAGAEVAVGTEVDVGAGVCELVSVAVAEGIVVGVATDPADAWKARIIERYALMRPAPKAISGPDAPWSSTPFRMAL